ncbi:radical SAM domain-containing protein, partial [mine drainage metagenome]
VYIGNVAGNPYESTYCPSCGNVAIRRSGFSITEWRLDASSRCTNCCTKIPIIGGKPKDFSYRGIESVL